MRRTTFCPECGGTGSGIVNDIAEVFIWAPRCFTCDGAGILEGNALVHVPWAGSPLVTPEYVWRFFHIARAYIDGYGEARRGRRDPWIPELRYDILRDYLDDFDMDEITKCQIALYLTTFRGIGERDWKQYSFSYFAGII
jgi:hypothetical protein